MDAETSVEEKVSAVPTVLLEAISSHGLMKKVIAKATYPAENVQEILNSSHGKKYDGPMVMKMVSSLRSRAFLCLNNLFEAVTIDDLGGADSLFEVWTNLGQLVFESNADEASSAMRAATEKLVEAKSPQLEQLAITDLQKLLEFGAKQTEASVRTNVVVIAGSLGMLFVNKSNDKAKLIAQFLVEAATRDVECRVIAEALDKIFDVFAEDDTDELFVELDLLSKLKQMQPGLKVKINMLKRNRGQDQETHGLVNMAKTNLVRFIKYKEKRPAIKAKQKPANGSSNGHS